MTTPNIQEVVGGLRAVAGGRPQALQHLVEHYAASAATSLLPPGVSQLPSLLPVRFANGQLHFEPKQLEGAFTRVLGTLSPEALRALQGITQLVPSGLPGLLGLGSQVPGPSMFEQVGSHLLEAAGGRELQQFTRMGRELGVVASAGSLEGVFAPSPASMELPPTLPPQGPLPAADDSSSKAASKEKKKPAPAPIKVQEIKTDRVNAKKIRYEKRMDLIKKAEERLKKEENPKVRRAVSRFKADIIAVERWRLAADAYNWQVVLNPTQAAFDKAAKLQYRVLADYPAANGQPRRVIFRRGEQPEGWLAREIVDDDTTGLNVVVYESTFEKGKFVAAFGGTELNDIGEKNGSIPKDVWADFTQGGASVFRSRQYDQAVQVARRLYNKYPNLDYTGHSLGGGLATLAGLLFDKNTYTYNTAGLHKKTLQRFGFARYEHAQARADKIINIHSANDPLTKLQVGADSVRRWTWDRGDIPSSFGPSRTVGQGPHGPGGTGIEEQLEEEKSADSRLLDQFVAGKLKPTSKPKTKPKAAPNV